MIDELLNYEIQTLNADGVWVHHSYERPSYKYEDRTVTRQWWIFGYSYTRRVCVNEREARVKARKRALRKARRTNKSIPARVLMTVRFRNHADYVTYETWDQGR